MQFLEKEALFRRSLIAKRALKRHGSDDRTQKNENEDDDEYLSIQPVSTFLYQRFENDSLF